MRPIGKLALFKMVRAIVKLHSLFGVSTPSILHPPPPLPLPPELPRSRFYRQGAPLHLCKHKSSRSPVLAPVPCHPNLIRSIMYHLWKWNKADRSAVREGDMIDRSLYTPPPPPSTPPPKRQHYNLLLKACPYTTRHKTPMTGRRKSKKSFCCHYCGLATGHLIHIC